MANLTFGEKLADLRIKKGMTQKELGEILGVNSRTVSAYEANKVRPPYDKIVIIAEYFSVSYDYIMKTEDYSQSTLVDFGHAYETYHDTDYSLGELYRNLISLGVVERECALAFLDLLRNNPSFDIIRMIQAMSEMFPK